MQAVVVATVLAMLALLVTPLGLISAAVIALTFLRQGWKEGGLVLGSALLAITGLGGLLFQMPAGTLLVGVLLWVPAAALGAILGRTGSLRLAIEAAAVLAAVVVRAQEILHNLESTEFDREGRPRLAHSGDEPSAGARQLALFTGQEEAVVEELRKADPDSLTPLQALALLAELKKRLAP